MNRRRFFLSTSSLVAAASVRTSYAFPARGSTGERPPVVLAGDDEPITPERRVEILGDLMQVRKDIGDSYLSGTIVQELERSMAIRTGKEAGVFLPTGTLANQLALRVLCRGKRRVLLQEESHVYRDESDAASATSGIALIPIGKDKAVPELDEVADAIKRSDQAPYPVPIGAISLESPVRRQSGAGISLQDVRQIASMAREKGIGLHLDGARLLLFSGKQDFDLAEYTAPFDTVYVSLYKYLGAPFGAILTGSKENMEEVRGLRHVMGGTIAHGWQPALYALNSLADFSARFTKARQTAEAFVAEIVAAGFRTRRVQHESNIIPIDVPERYRADLAERLQRNGIVAAIAPNRETFDLSINTSILRKSSKDIAAAFLSV